MRITVNQGRMVVSSIDLVVGLPDVKVFEIDLSSKYPDECWYSIGEQDITIIIPAGPYSLKMDDKAISDTSVQILLGDKPAYWNVVTNSGRYTVRLVLYQESNRHEVWSSPNHLRKDD